MAKGYDKPTLAQLAEKSGVTVDHLKVLGWSQGEGEIERKDGSTFRVCGVRIPYYRRVAEGEEGAIVLAGKGVEENKLAPGVLWPVVEIFAKVRASLEGDPKYLHERPGEPGLYGEWLLDEFKARPRPKGLKGGWPYLILVEGETDTGALLFKGLPAAGIPGVDLVAKVLKAEHLDGFEKLLIIREPGESGLKFCQNIAARLKELAWAGPALVIELPEKDAAAQLRESGEAFLADFREAAGGAVPLGKVVSGEEIKGLVSWGDKVKLRRTRFLMSPYFPIRHLTLLVGTPGLGKSYSMMAVAALLSRGQVLPVCDPETSKPGNGVTLVFAADDNADETLMPRFLACGGDPSKLAIYRQDLKKVSLADLDTIRQVVEHVEPSLIFFDPVLRFTGQATNANSAEDVIGVLEPLCDLAGQYGAALVGVGWAPKKAVGAAMSMFAGSVAWAGTMRSGVTVQAAEATEDDSPGVRRGVLSHAKASYSACGRSLGFEIRAEPAVLLPEVAETLSAGDKEIVKSAGSFLWTGEVNRTADQMASQGDGAGSAALAVAKGLIRDVLGGKGDVPQAQLDAAMKASGVGFQTWNTARLDLGVAPQRDPQTDQWMVRLDEMSEDGTPPGEAPF